MKKLLDLYKKGAHYLSDKGDGYTKAHMVYRVALVAYSAPVILWAISREVVLAASESVREVSDYIRFNH